MTTRIFLTSEVEIFDNSCHKGCGAATQRAKLDPVEQGENTITRRDVVKGAAKVSVAGAAIAWAAPKFDSVAYAADTTGSPPPDTSTTSTTGGGGGDDPECRIDPRVIVRSRLPFRIRVIGSKWAPSSQVRVTIVGVRNLGTVTTNANGAFDTRVEVPFSVTAGKYRIEMSGYDNKGNRYRCFRDFEVTDSTGGQGTTSTGGSDTTIDGSNTSSGNGGNSGSGSGNGNGSGTLPETGSDSRTLLLVGAGAVVAGRSLYALRNRIANASADGNLSAR